MLRGEEEADATRCVSWSVNHFSRQGGEANGQAVVGAGVRRRYFGRGDTEPTGPHLHRPQQTEILLIEKHRRSGHLLKQGRSAYVVDVSVGDDNLPQGEAMLLQPGEDLRNVVSGIDDDGVMRSLIAQDGAIAAQRSDRKTFEDHVPILDADYNAAMRIYATVGALLGWFALALQLFLMLVNSPAGGVAILGTLITFFSFFTILTNLLVALVFAAAVFRPGPRWMEFLRRPSVQAGTAVYIAIVGIVYQLLLRQLWNPQGAQWVADVLLHRIIPLGYVLYWLLFAPRSPLRWKDAVAWLAYPGVYLVYILARGAVSGLYPYPFVDVNELGYAGVFTRAGIFLLVFLGMGLLVVAVARWTRRRPAA
jgi:hypothetical protein